MKHLKTVALGASLFLMTTLETQANCVPCPLPEKITDFICVKGVCFAHDSSQSWQGQTTKGLTAKNDGVKLKLVSPPAPTPDFKYTKEGRPIPLCRYVTNETDHGKIIEFEAINYKLAGKCTFQSRDACGLMSSFSCPDLP